LNISEFVFKKIEISNSQRVYFQKDHEI